MGYISRYGFSVTLNDGVEEYADPNASVGHTEMDALIPTLEAALTKHATLITQLQDELLLYKNIVLAITGSMSADELQRLGQSVSAASVLQHLKQIAETAAV